MNSQYDNTLNNFLIEINRLMIQKENLHSQFSFISSVRNENIKIISFYSISTLSLACLAFFNFQLLPFLIILISFIKIVFVKEKNNYKLRKMVLKRSSEINKKILLSANTIDKEILLVIDNASKNGVSKRYIISLIKNKYSSSQIPSYI